MQTMQPATAPAVSPEAPEPRWFCWRGPWRADFVTLTEAMDWQRENGGVVTQSASNPEGPSGPTVGQVAMADRYGSSSGEE